MLHSNLLQGVFALLILAAALPASSFRATFEDLNENDVVTSQYALAGLQVFGSPVILTAGSTLNEIDFPPASGSNVLVDALGAVTFQFEGPMIYVSGFVTHTVTLRFDLLRADDSLLLTAFSLDGANLGISEEFRFDFPVMVGGKLIVSGDPSGFSYALDDLSFGTPEPPAFSLAAIALALVFLSRKLKSVRRGGASLLLLVLFVGGKGAHGQALRRVNSLGAVPPVVLTNTLTTVTFTAEVEHHAELLRDAVQLTQVDATGRLLQTLGRMYDDGTHGDPNPNDNNFTLQLGVQQPITGKLFYRATAAFRGVLQRAQSPTATLTISTGAFSAPVEPTTVQEDAQHNRFPVNQLVVTLAAGAPRSLADAIAASVGGVVVGQSPLGNQYQIRVPATTIAALNTIQTNLAANPAVIGSSKNYLGVAQAPISTDLLCLRAAGGQTGAYDRIKVNEAHQFLADLAVADPSRSVLAPVRVGIIDTGVARSHAEFAGVSFAAGSATNDAASGHGTGVTAIIGANNVAGTGVCQPSQMNGILSGLSGSAPVPYVLDMRGSPTGDTISFTDLWTAVDAAIAGGDMVVYIGFSFFGPSVGCASSISGSDFTTISNGLYDLIAPAGSVTFVVPAGNCGGDAVNALPANLSTRSPNVITVASTDLSDAKAATSNFGSAVTLAAPGVSVYTASPTGYHLMDGTSAAAAMAAGSAALLRSLGVTQPQQIRDILKATGDPISTVLPIGGTRLNLRRAVGYQAQPIDVFFLLDTTGSVSGTLGPFQLAVREVIQRLSQTPLKIRFGVGSFRDYAISPFGEPGDRAYTRHLDSTIPQDTPLGQNIINVVSTLTAGGGFDVPESQLTALYHAASQLGRSVPAPYAAASIAAGQNVHWSPASKHVVILFTDASFHLPGDAGAISYPGPSMDETISVLRTASIQVIGVQAGRGGSSTYDTVLTTQLNRVAQETGALAQSTIDCRGDGTFRVLAGQPIVCQLGPTGAGIAEAIINSLTGLLLAP